MFELLTSRRDTNRGQAGLIGALLMFGLIVLVLVLLQVTAVPVWNGNLEFEHNNRIHEDIQNLETGLSQATTTGNERLVTVKLGLQYPERPFLFNPADPAGRLETTEPARIRVNNSELIGVDNYWSTSQAFETRALQYRPNYNEYERAPTTVYEHGQVYNRFDDGAVRPLSSGSIVNGKRISLVALRGDTSEAATGTRSFTVTPTSAPAQPVQLEPERPGQPIIVEIPTLLNESQWDERLGDEVDSGGPGTDADTDRYISELRVTSTSEEPYDTLRLRFEPDTTYSLRMVAASIGNEPLEPAAYVTGVDEPTAALSPGESVRLTFQVRDQYNNPVAGVPVTFPALGSGEGTVTAVDTVSGEDGEAVVLYTAPATPPTDGTVNVTATAAGSTASKTVSVDDSSTRGFNDPSLVNPPAESGGVYVTRTTLVTSGVSTNAKTDTLKICLRNAGDARTFSRVRLVSATGEQFSPSSAQLYSTGEANSKTLKPHGPFTDVSGVVSSVSTGQTRAISFNFDDDFSTGSSKGDIVRFAIEYKRGTLTETMTYELLAETRTFQTGESC